MTRRRLLALPVAGAGAAALHATVPHSHPWDGQAAAAGERDGDHGDLGAAGDHASFRDGRTVDHRANGFDPHAILRDFDWGTTRHAAGGRVVREWELHALDKDTGRTLDPTTVGGLLAGMAIMFATGLLVSM